MATMLRTAAGAGLGGAAPAALRRRQRRAARAARGHGVAPKAMAEEVKTSTVERTAAAPAEEDPEAAHRRMRFVGGIPTVGPSNAQRSKHQLKELYALNARLAGEQPHVARKNVEWLARQRNMWDTITEHVTAAGADGAAEVEDLQDKIARALQEEKGEGGSGFTALMGELLELQAEVVSVNAKARSSERGVARSMARIRSLESEAQKLSPVAAAAVMEARADTEDGCDVEDWTQSRGGGEEDEGTDEEDAAASTTPRMRRKAIRGRFADDRSLATPAANTELMNHWYPVMFSSKVEVGATPYAFEMLNRKWELTASGAPEAPVYHVTLAAGEANWGEGVSRNTLTTGVRDGLVMVWPGESEPEMDDLPDMLAPPEGYITHAELVIDDVPVEHALLLENLLDLAHAPFTHTGTFAKGWGVPNGVKFATARMRKAGEGWHDMGNALASPFGIRGEWNPYPIDMSFEAPCCVLSHIGLAKAGAAGSGAQFEKGTRPADCGSHLHQLHVCVPGTEGHTRLLYRMSLDFANWAEHIPGMELVWTEMANQVLGEDLRLVEGQQDRMERGGRVWGHPVGYDKCAISYRRWRNVQQGDESCHMLD